MTGTKLGKRDIAVFIASAGDPGPERQQFHETIETLNTGFGDGVDVKFESLGEDGVICRVMTGGFNAEKKSH